MVKSFDIDAIKDTDELQTFFPQTENEKWEFKTAKSLHPEKTQELKNELAVQASAFANTRQGCLIYGYPNGDYANPEPCVVEWKGRPMEEFLEKTINMSVDSPLESFKVRRIPIAKDLQSFVFVVAFERSPLAPHQSRHNLTYYWRVGSESKPAPHGYLELLRNQSTKSVLKIEKLEASIVGGRTFEENGSFVSELILGIHVDVRNISLMWASMWGVHYKFFSQGSWHGMSSIVLPSGSLRPTKDNLLPDELYPVSFNLQNTILTKGNKQEHQRHVLEVAGEISCELRPVSHDCIGKPVVMNFSESKWQQQLLKTFVRSWKHVFTEE